MPTFEENSLPRHFSGKGSPASMSLMISRFSCSLSGVMNGFAS
jgi:hypothetical protein